MKNAHTIETDSSSGSPPPPASPYSRRRPRNRTKKVTPTRPAPPPPPPILNYDEIVELPEYEEIELKQTNYLQPTKSQSVPEESFVFNFDSATGSPYSRRYPASARKMRFVLSKV